MLLSIDIEARFAKFSDGLEKIQRDVDRSVGRMSKSFSSLKGIAASFIGTFAGIAAVGGIKSVINDLEKLNTVSERTGIAAKELSGLAFAAGQTGTDLEVMAKSINKLNIALSGLASGKNKELKETLTALGLPEFAKGAISAEEALLQLAEVFPRLSEADQSALALAAFGKAGQEMIPALKGGRKELEALIKSGKELFPVTNDLAKSADDFNDAMAKVGLVLKSALLEPIKEILPLLTSLAEGLANGKRAGFGFFESLELSLRGKPATGYQDQIAALTKQIEAAEKAAKSAKTTFLGIKTGPADATPIEELKRRRDFLKAQASASALASTGGVDVDEGRFRKRSQPDLKLPSEKAKGKGGRTRAAVRDDSAQRLLEQQIKDFERSINQERDLAATRNDFLQRFYDDGLISLADYSKARVDILEESSNAQKIALGSEIALLEASKKGKAGDDRIAIDTKINELLEKQADLNRDAKIAGANIYLDNIKAGNEYADVLERINIRSLESKGDFAGAAKAQFALDNREDLTKIDTGLKSESTTPQQRAALELAKEQINAQGEMNEKIARFNALADETARLRNDAADDEERINIAVEQGAIGEIEGLQQISLLREKLLLQLTEQGEKLENIALLTKDPSQMDGVKALGIEIERLNAQLDPLRDKVEDMLSSGFSGFVQDIASGTVSAKQAFKSMIDDFTKRLTAFISDQFFKQLFGEKGALGGVAGLLSGSGGQPQQQQQPQQQGGSFAGALASFFGQGNSQPAAPVSQGVPSSLGSGSAGAGADAASALKDVATSSTATSFALQEFSDQGVAGATQSLFENVAASSIEQSAEQTATVSMTALSIATDAATAAMVKQATAQAISGAVGGVGKAEGGLVTGPGTGTSDSIPVLLSNKEFVVRAKPVQEPGALAFLTRFNKLGMKSLPRFSLGGLVGRSMGMSNLAMAGYGTTLVQNFTVEARTPKETQQQLASSAYQGGMRAFRRNR